MKKIRESAGLNFLQSWLQFVRGNLQGSELGGIPSVAVPAETQQGEETRNARSCDFPSQNASRCSAPKPGNARRFPEDVHHRRERHGARVDLENWQARLLLGRPMSISPIKSSGGAVAPGSSTRDVCRTDHD